MQRIARILMVSFLVLYGFYLYQPSLFTPWLNAIQGKESALPGAQEQLRRHTSSLAKAAQSQLLEQAQQGINAGQIAAAYFGSAEALCLHQGFVQTMGIDKPRCLNQIDQRRSLCDEWIARQIAEPVYTHEQIRIVGKRYVACLIDPNFTASSAQ